MTTRLKTIEYHFPVLGSITDNTLTSFTPINIYIPENSISFKSVFLDIMLNDITTATGNNVTTRTMSLYLGEASESTITNTNTLTNTGENITFIISGDYTSYFTNNWSGNSMSCGAKVLTIQSGGTTTGMRDATACLFITYEYDDNSPTQIKTVRLPLNAPVTELPTSKQASPTSSIPSLDNWLPENNKTIREISIIIQGNDSVNAVGDITIYSEIDSLGTMQTNPIAAALASARWFRYYFTFDTENPSASNYLDINDTHSFYLWCSTAARCYHLQVWLNITYEYDESTSETIMNSLLLPMEIDSPFGHSSGDYQQSTRSFYIEEPETITLKESAAYIFWDDVSAMTGLSFNINNNGWIAYTDNAGNLCGGNGAMFRCEDYINLNRGKNTITLGTYRTAATVGGCNANALWMINYTSSKHPNGSGSHNHTIISNIVTTGTIATVMYSYPTNIQFAPPEENIYFNSIGFNYIYNSSTSYGLTIQTMKKSSEGFQAWLPIYTDVGQTDAEYGIRQIFAQAKDIFKRFTGDVKTTVDVSSFRNYRIWLSGSSTAFHYLNFISTYHSITSSISGNVSNYTGDGSEITVDIFRASTNEHILSTTTETNGNYSITWFDNTEPLFAIARQAGVYVGRSDNFYAELENPSQ